YPNGFGLTLHSSNDRVPKDAELVQALGQMLSRGGLKINGVVALPYAVYATAATKREYSAFVFTLGVNGSNTGPSLRQALGTYDEKTGAGGFNRGRYSNPKFDALLDQAMAEFDEHKRDALLQEATRLAFGD